MELHLVLSSSSALKRSNDADRAAPSIDGGQYRAELQLTHKAHAGRTTGQSVFV